MYYQSFIVYWSRSSFSSIHGVEGSWTNPRVENQGALHCLFWIFCISQDTCHHALWRHWRGRRKYSTSKIIEPRGSMRYFFVKPTCMQTDEWSGIMVTLDILNLSAMILHHLLPNHLPLILFLLLSSSLWIRRS